MSQIENVVIVGSGPAGYTAALYTSRANLEPVVVEGFLWGGLLQQTTDVENYPGFPAGIMGPELMQQMRDQAERFGTRFITDLATGIELAHEPGGVHQVHVGGDTIRTWSVVLAMGAEHKKIGAPGEELLSGRGVSYCATCDAAFFAGKDCLIVGGGDSAMEEAIFLSKFASKVTIVNRRDEFRASQIMQDRAREIDNIEWLTPYVVDEFTAGETGALEAAVLRHADTGETRELPIAGAFIAIGHVPQSEILAGQRCSSTTRATWSSTGGRRGPASRASSPRAISSTTPTGRRSPPRAPAARRRSTRSGTCATRRRCRRRRACRRATSPKRSTQRRRSRQSSTAGAPPCPLVERLLRGACS